MSQVVSRALPVVLLGVVLAVATGAVAWSVTASGKLPEGPVDVVWDKAPCAACSMHVGEPPFAAQLTTTGGDTHVFDDPGCLFLFVDKNELDIHSMYFRHLYEDRWIERDAVAFELREQTPMGFGIGAVDAGTADAISFEQARKKCIDRVSNYRSK